MSTPEKRSVSRRDLLKGFAIGGGMVTAATLMAGCAAAEAETGLPEEWDYEADFVSVGMGGGGMMGAIGALKAGATALIMEKGSSAHESSTSVCAFEYVCAGTSTQKELGITDSAEQFMQYFKDNSPEGLQKYDLIEAYLPVSVELYEWLLSLGCECAGVKTWPGMDQPRLHTLGSAKPTAVMIEQCEQLGAQILYETSGQKLIMKDGRVIGVEALKGEKTIYVKAKKGVLLANGGYEGNKEMLYAYHGPVVSKRQPAGTNNNTGDGYKMAWAIGAATEDMWIDPPPAVAFASAKGTAYGLYHAGGILVNKEGARFVNESETHTVEANALAAQTDGIGYVITDAKQLADSIATLTWERQANQNGKSYTADTLEDLAAQIGIPADVLVATVKKYNDNIDADGTDPDFGRAYILKENVESPLDKIDTPPYYSLGLIGANFPTESGLVIDAQARVYDVWGNVIPGLYATGLMANLGIKYPPEPRTLTAVSGAMVFGYLAGQDAFTQTAWDAEE